MSEPSKATAEENGESVLRVLLPYLAVTALVAATLVLGVLKVTGMTDASRPRVNAVVFDIIRLSNAQRAVASSMIKQDEASVESAQLLLDVSKRTRDAIAKAAGPGTLVLVKQAVVSQGLPDITEEVLKELGLPYKVPTQDPMGYLTEVAPTYLSMMRQQEQKPTSAAVPSGSVLP
jgi:hypothetical protein